MTQKYARFETGTARVAANRKSLRVYLWMGYQFHRFLNHRWFLIGNKHVNKKRALNKKSAQYK
jgi:hypothetical protein